MYPNEFVTWLKGFIEISDPKTITSTQVEIIKAKLATVEDQDFPPFIYPEQSYTLSVPKPLTDSDYAGMAKNTDLRTGSDAISKPMPEVALNKPGSQATTPQAAPFSTQTQDQPVRSDTAETKTGHFETDEVWMGKLGDPAGPRRIK